MRLLFTALAFLISLSVFGQGNEMEVENPTDNVFYLKLALVLMIYCGVFGLIGSVISRMKGRRPIAGFLWGFCLQIIGVFIVMLLPSKKEGPNILLEKWNKYIFLNHKNGAAQGFAGLGIMFIAMGLFAIISGRLDGDSWMVFPVGIGAIIWSFISEAMDSNR